MRGGALSVLTLYLLFTLPLCKEKAPRCFAHSPHTARILQRSAAKFAQLEARSNVKFDSHLSDSVWCELLLDIDLQGVLARRAAARLSLRLGRKGW